MKPVFGFNSSHISVSGGYLQGFHELSKSVYSVDIQADDDIVSINVPKNITKDVAGNGNLASNILQIRCLQYRRCFLLRNCCFWIDSLSCRAAHHFNHKPSIYWGF